MPLLAVLALGVCAGGARAATVVVVTGRGWGHGVGMSQWGARGYALHGWSWRQILAHYYPGTQLASTANVTVRVLLGASQPGADVECAAGMRVGDATGRTFALPAKTYNVGPGLLVRKHRLQSPIAFYCNGGPLVWDGRAYHGTLVVYERRRPARGRRRGRPGGLRPRRRRRRDAAPVAARRARGAGGGRALVRPRDAAPAQALRPVRGRPQPGVRRDGSRRRRARSTPRRRRRGGSSRTAAASRRRTSSPRRAGVPRTCGTSGRSSAAVPYLRSVPDPYDVDSPVHDWGPFALSPAALVGAAAAFRSARCTSCATGRDASRASRSEASRSRACEVMRLLHLRSTWFSVGALSLTDSRSSVVFGRQRRARREHGGNGATPRCRS